ADCRATRKVLMNSRNGAARSRQPRRAAALTTGGAALAVLALLVTACSGSGPGAQATGNQGAGAAGNRPKITISPASGPKAADPSAGITVPANTGRLTNVTVQTGGSAVSGMLSPNGRTWHSQWALDVGESYTVKATATRRGGKPFTTTSAFRTLTP